MLFEKFDWKQLEPLLTSYHKINLNEYLFNIDSDSYSPSNIPLSKSNKFKSSSSITQTSEQIKPWIKTINDEFSISFDEAHFRLGCVSFKKHIKQLRKELDITIPNEHILAEFDNVKFWFAKKLKSKKFKVHVTITLTDGAVADVLATSNHINQITPELIDSVKDQRTLALAKEPKFKNPDKSLFSINEIFKQIDTEDKVGNVFKQSEEDVLNFFVEKKSTRNKKQLAYLSSEKQSENHKIRYTLHPNFGFLFLIEGIANYHFVWELLNSHATYIWSVNKGLDGIESHYKRIEAIINLIRSHGREYYKQSYRNNLQDNDLVFWVISHEDIASNSVDDFIKWKSKINEQLI